MKTDRKLLYLFIMFMALFAFTLAAAPDTALAAAADCSSSSSLTGSISQIDAYTIQGTVTNCTGSAVDVGLATYAVFAYDPNTDYIDAGLFDYALGTVGAGETLKLTADIPPGCHSKVWLFRGTAADLEDPLSSPVNDAYRGKWIARQVFDRILGVCEPPPPPPPDNPGTGTPGYWMNHPEAWPVDEITIGGMTYSKDDAIALMQAPVKGDKTLTMFPALVSAKLNVQIGNDDSCIAGTIDAADAWMAENPVGSKVKGNSQAWKDGEPLYWALDAYNNGLMCAPHRD